MSDRQAPQVDARAGPGRVRLRAVLLALTLGVVLMLAWAVDRGRPVRLADAAPAAAAAAQRLPCVSYAPFRRDGHSPFDAALTVTPQQIESDLRLLSEVTGCVRTYGVDHGLDAVPAIARRLGMRVVLGAWIGRDPQGNQRQLQRALALAREHADVVVMLMVGNEVLLRRELSAQALAELLAQARRDSTVPVSYADVWEFWLRHGDVLRAQVDIVSAHVLPYWEDEPVAVAGAADHVQRVAGRMRQAFAPLPVFIAETGWPAAGRQRGPARAGTVEQTRFVRDLLALQPATSTGLPAYNLIEGFDQPWKRVLEGAVGGYWGLFEADGRRRVQFDGPVPAPVNWLQIPLAGLAGGFIAVVCVRLPAWRRRRGATGTAQTSMRIAALLAALLSGTGIGMAGMWQWQLLQLSSRGRAEWAHGALLATLALACAAVAACRLAVIADGDADADHGGGRTGAGARGWRAGIVAAWSTPCSVIQRGFATLRFMLLFAVALAALALMVDPRYRPLLWPAVLPGAALLLALAGLGDRLDHSAREERLLAAVAALSIPLILWQESWRNAQAWAAVLPWLALAIAAWWPHRAAPAASIGAIVRGRTSTSAASNSAGPAQSSE